MTGSLKRHPSEEPEESPRAKRRESSEPDSTIPEETTSDAPTAETSPIPEKPKTGSFLDNSTPTALFGAASKTELPSFLSPPTKVGGVSITEKAGVLEDKTRANGTGSSILSSGFSLIANNNNSNGSKFANKGTSIFAAAMSNISTSASAGIFGSSSTSSSGFVFGGNMSDRVVCAEPEPKSPANSNSVETPTSQPESSTDSKKPALKELEVASGEEDERRVLQTSCKLYQFCPIGKKWVDRGGGTLRLNEKDHGQSGSSSRIVVRSKAVMKVMLNTKVFADMIVNRPNLTTLRISGFDEGKMCTYLIKCTRNECDKLHTAILKKREEERHKVEELPQKEVPETGSYPAERTSTEPDTASANGEEKANNEKETEEDNSEEKKVEETEENSEEEDKKEPEEEKTEEEQDQDVPEEEAGKTEPVTEDEESGDSKEKS